MSKTPSNSRILIALPAYNEGPVIAGVVAKIKAAGYANVVVVDDGSKDNTAKSAERAGAIVLVHPINRGAGAATATALAYAKRENYDFVVFMDADGQHDPADIARLVSVAHKYDVVIGSRNVLDVSMPLLRKIYNRVGSIVTWMFFGLYVYDSQSGFKVFNKKAMNCVRITFDRYEFCSEIIGEIHRNKLQYTEIPIKVIYTSHSKAKGQSFGNGIKMVLRFLFKS